MKQTFALIVILTLFLQPLSVVAQGISEQCAPITASNYEYCCINPGIVGNANECFIFSTTTPQCTSITASNYQQCCVNPGTQGNPTQCFIFSSKNPTGTNPGTTTPSTTASPGRYSPSITIGSSSGSFGGVRFAGVGSALLGCSGGDALVSKGIGAAQNLLAKGVKTGVKAVASFFGLGGLADEVLEPEEQKVKEEGLRNKENCLDKVAYVLAQQALSQMTTKTLNWVNTGFDGNPLYVRDINSYLKSVRNQELVNYFQQVQGSDPIFGSALRSIITQQVTGKGGVNERICIEYSTSSKCIRYGTTAGFGGSSMNTPQARAYNDFLGDFTKGGWSALLNTSNNPLSALFSATNNLGTTLGTQQQNIQNELNQGNGFLNMRKCVEYASQGQVGSGNGAGLSNEPACLRYETITPGSIIAQQVGTVTGSPVRQAELADEFNEALGSFFDSLLNKLFSKDSGLAGLKGGAMTSLGATNLGNNVIFDSNGNALSIGGVRAFDLPEFSTGVNATFDISRPQQVRAVLQSQYNFRNSSLDTVIAAARVLPLIGKLDYCLPGPNPLWQEGVTDNFESMVGAVKFVGTGNFDAVIVPFGITDKVRGTKRTVTSRSGMFELLGLDAGQEPYYGKGFRFNTEPSDAEIKDYFREVLQLLAREIASTYTPITIANAFASTGSASEQTYNRGVATTAYRTASTLVPYAQNVNELVNSYSQSTATVESNIAELEAIHAEVLQIVKVAKARYIQARAAAGTPVNMQCINNAYTIDERPVTGQPRQESDTPSQLLIDMEAANNYFNGTL